MSVKHGFKIAMSLQASDRALALAGSPTEAEAPPQRKGTSHRRNVSWGKKASPETELANIDPLTQASANGVPRTEGPVTLPSPSAFASPFASPFAALSATFDPAGACPRVCTSI